MDTITETETEAEFGRILDHANWTPMYQATGTTKMLRDLWRRLDDEEREALIVMVREWVDYVPRLSPWLSEVRPGWRWS